MPKPKAQLPPGTVSLRFEDAEGIILVEARLHGRDRDTTGLLVLDTGAGFLALDAPVAERLGLLEDIVPPGSMDFAEHALQRLELDALQIDQLSPVLVLDGQMVKDVTDRPVLGLLGERALAGRSVLIDYQADVVHLVPAFRRHDREPANQERGAPESNDTEPLPRHPFGPLLSPRSRAVPFVLEGDGKIVVVACVGSSPSPTCPESLTLVVDTGASKCVIFEPALERIPGWRLWRSLTGLVAPTLLGVSEARLVRVPHLALETGGEPVARSQVDAAIIDSPLGRALSTATGRRIDGLLGHSFLRRYRLGIDYAQGMLWLDPLPVPWDDRRYEYSHVGVQAERRGTAIEVVGIVDGSPAARAGITVGDTIVAIDGRPVGTEDLLVIVKRLEGPPGSVMRLTVRGASAPRTYRLVRRRLL